MNKLEKKLKERVAKGPADHYKIVQKTERSYYNKQGMPGKPRFIREEDYNGKRYETWNEAEEALPESVSKIESKVEYKKGFFGKRKKILKEDFLERNSYWIVPIHSE